MSQSAERVDAFLKQPRIGVLGTLNRDGSPNAMPLWYEWDGAKIRMFTSENTAKIRRLRNDPRACLTVADGVGVPGDWVSLEGEVAILDQGARELACRLARLYYEPAQAQEAIALWSKAKDMLLLELTPTRIRAWSRLEGFYTERV